MNQTHQPGSAIGSTLALFAPEPNTLYPLEHVAQLLDLSRRWIALCARHGLIHPAFDPLMEGWFFDAEAIHTLRLIEQLRALRCLNMPAIKLVLDLRREVETLRAEIRYLRNP